MFYINAPSIFKRREKLFFQLVPSVAIFMVFFTIVIFSWFAAGRNVVDEQRRVLTQKNMETASLVRQRMDAYEQILRGGAGLFNASAEVSRSEWRSYLRSYDITRRYPGIQGVGYTIILKPEEVTAHVKSVRAEGFGNYSIKPAGNRSVYSSIVYIEPFRDRNQRVFGYDMYTEPNRREGMNAARDSGEPRMSRLVRLIQEPDSPNPQPGFLIYMPVYSPRVMPQTVDERRTHLKGFVYLPFRAYDLVNNIISRNDQSYGFRILSTANGKQQEMYVSPSYAAINNTESKQQQNSTIQVAGTTWDIQGIVSQDVVSKNVSDRPSSLMFGGTLFCLVIAGFVYLLLGNRSRALAEKEELGIQQAKDDLLALASHQLRTPATGVKQYVGMLREGYAGPLTDTQRKLLEKAYESNERQLGTINEMLFVARSDAGHLKMYSERFDFTALARDIADEQRSVIKQHAQKMVVKIPRQKLYVKGDKQYIRMALENLLSNATKYTREGGIIHLTVKAQGSRVLFRVEDTGVGVSKKHQQLLFKKFSRIPNELTNQVVGSGIGLYLAKQVVDGHKGTIAFESAENKGSKVTVTLPRLKSAKTSSRKSTD